MTTIAERPTPLDALKSAVRTYASRNANADGRATTPIAGLGMMCVAEPGRPIRSLYRPLVSLVLQGTKRLVAGREERVVAAGQAVIVGIDMPVLGQVLSASRAEPYLAVAMEIELAVLQEVALALPGRRATPAVQQPLFSDDLDDDLIGCAVRLMRLVDRPEAAAVMRPAVMQELHYWLLSSRHGPDLRALAVPDGQTRRIARAIERLRADFREPIAIDELAALTHMSPSAFHRHFRVVTTLSPLQFQKQLRLIEARRLMLNEGMSASNAGFDVGYGSISQFTREYARLFGAPPRQDVAARIEAIAAE